MSETVETPTSVASTPALWPRVVLFLCLLPLCAWLAVAPNRAAVSPLRTPAPVSGSFRYISSSPMLAEAGAGAVLFSAPAWAFATEAARVVPPAPPGGEMMPFFDAPAGHKAQDGEDEYAFVNFFANKRGGLILESGALDGDQFSVSWFFARNLQWRAVHVEGSPTSYAKLVVNRPEALNIHSALCNSSRTLHYATGSHPAVSGFWEFMPEWIRNFYDSSQRTDAAIAALPLVACRPLGPILSVWGVTHIDFWVLDVEGAEEEVLATIDFSLITIDVIVIELDGANGAKDERCRDILKRNGFLFKARQVRNDWWVRGGFIGSSVGES